MQIIENKALLFRTRNPDKYSIIPKHKVLEADDDGIHEVAVYWGLDEARVLHNLGVKNVPSPITKRYSWPGRYRPMQHQIDTAAFLTMHRRAFCFNDPGTGKTMSALWAADYLIEKGYVRRVLVLCPLSIMQSAWMQDLNNAIMHRSAIVAHHTQSSRRIEMIQQDYTFVITNYDGLALVAPEITRDGRFDLIIVDEANCYKNATTNRWKALASIIKPETYLWMMTGTPASQSPVDAYGLAKLVNPSGIPKYLSAWRDMTMHKITQFKWAPKPNAAELVFDALQPAIRFTKGQCLDLPPVITVTRDVPMTPQQSKYYRLLKEQMMVKAAGETISAVNAGVAVSKLLQISCGAAYTDDREVVEFDASPRLAVLEEVLQETKRKVLIFAMFRSSIDAVATYLNKKGYPTEQIQGDVSPAKRTRIIHDFQTTDNLRVLVLQPAAAAHGLTLTAADTVIFYGPLMSVEMYTQCIARADRKGQDSDKVTVVHLQSSHIEREMFKAMNSKVSEHALLVNLFNEEIKS
jgi:superfamily II DNA or RNA helicase